MKLYPMKLGGVYKSTLWGGERLKRDYGFESDNNIAESWLLTLREKEQNLILNGEHKGKSISAVYNSADFCGKSYDVFPLLIKFIDAADSLSVQVHPDDVFAHEKNLPCGKTEAWYIVEAEPNSKLVYGMKSCEGIDKKTLEAACENGTIEEYLNFIPVKAGETYFIPAGTVHAIGAGILIAEVQQNSDTTYRMYDYNRKGADGKKRELHITDAVACAKLDFEYKKQKSVIDETDFGSVEQLCGCEYFSMEKHCIISGKTECFFGKKMRHLTVLDGSGELIYGEERLDIKKGDSILIPYLCENVRAIAKSDLKLLCASL